MQEQEPPVSMRDLFPDYGKAEQRGKDAKKAFARSILEKINEVGLTAIFGQEYEESAERIKEILQADSFELSNFNEGSIASVGISSSNNAVMYLHGVDVRGYISTDQWADLQRYHELFHEPTGGRIREAYYGKKAFKDQPAIAPDPDKAKAIIEKVLAKYPPLNN